MTGELMLLNASQPPKCTPKKPLSSGAAKVATSRFSVNWNHVGKAEGNAARLHTAAVAASRREGLSNGCRCRREGRVVPLRLSACLSVLAARVAFGSVLTGALTAFAFPAAHRRRLRTISQLDRLNKEIERCTHVASLFSEEASLLSLVSVVLSENSDEWETERAYLPMEAR